MFVVRFKINYREVDSILCYGGFFGFQFIYGVFFSNIRESSDCLEFKHTILQCRKEFFSGEALYLRLHVAINGVRIDFAVLSIIFIV